MSHAPTFSIVTPSYNQAPFLAQTIESVLGQEGDFAVEYFVMDGGSTDGSVDIIRRYADQVSEGRWAGRCAGVRMEWVSEKDGGQTCAINKGLRRATGDFASYINSDDLFCPGAFARVARAFADQPEADFVHGDGDVIDRDGRLQWEWLSRPYNHSLMTSYHWLWNDFTNYILQQATFWRRRVHDRIGLFDESFNYAMDLEYWVRAGGAGLRFRHLPCKLGKFRLIAGTKSLSSPTVFWEDVLEIYRRHRGSRALGWYFAYYFYNVGRHAAGDPLPALADGLKVLGRWRELPEAERQEVERQARWGRDMGCLLLAASRQGRPGDAGRLVRAALRARPALLLRPVALACVLKRLSGQPVSALLDSLGGRLVHWYRSVRYDYRYRRRGTLPGGGA
ncbi:MAG TPA: glycosyltransferase family 2 protein [Gemmataceae bacterium]|nr:glycosyltransferase family 2 protein [Gemmataceae bacterium]